MSVGGAGGGGRGIPIDDSGASPAAAPAGPAVTRPEIDAALHAIYYLEKAFTGSGADVRTVLDIMERRSPREVALIDREWLTHHGPRWGTLRETLGAQLRGDEEARAVRALDRGRAAEPLIARETDALAQSPVYRKRNIIERASHAFWNAVGEFVQPLPH